MRLDAVQYRIVYLILIGGWISKSTILKYPDSEASKPDAKFTAIGFKASIYFKIMRGRTSTTTMLNIRSR
eukprot:SAG31_NODE_12230_length_957_cov_1.153846_2_plen_69_part_01